MTSIVSSPQLHLKSLFPSPSSTVLRKSNFKLQSFEKKNRSLWKHNKQRKQFQWHECLKERTQTTNSVSKLSSSSQVSMLIPQISSLLLLQEKKYTTHRKGFEITVCESKGRGYFDPFLTTATLEIIVHKPKFDSSSKVKLQTSIVRKKKQVIVKTQ